MTETRLATIDLLAREAIALVGDDSRAILGITGSPGAGKSTLVDLLLARIRTANGAEWAAHVPMDGFHLADAQLDRLGARARKGAPDTFDVAGYAHLLERVKQQTDIPVYVPGFDRSLEQPLAAALVVPPAARVVITEGNYLLLDDPCGHGRAGPSTPSGSSPATRTRVSNASSRATSSSGRAARRHAPGSTRPIGATPIWWRPPSVRPTESSSTAARDGASPSDLGVMSRAGRNRARRNRFTTMGECQSPKKTQPTPTC